MIFLNCSDNTWQSDISASIKFVSNPNVTNHTLIICGVIRIIGCLLKNTTDTKFIEIAETERPNQF